MRPDSKVHGVRQDHQTFTSRLFGKSTEIESTARSTWIVPTVVVLRESAVANLCQLVVSADIGLRYHRLLYQSASTALLFAGTGIFGK
jgi:hypothetical protein